MVERLFRSRIHLQRGGTAVAELEQAAAFILADEAEARLPVTDMAVTRTQVAVEPAVGHGLPPAGFVLLFLDDSEHGPGMSILRRFRTGCRGKASRLGESWGFVAQECGMGSIKRPLLRGAVQERGDEKNPRTG